MLKHQLYLSDLNSELINFISETLRINAGLKPLVIQNSADD